MNPARPTWTIVPYRGNTPFKRVRIRNEARIQAVMRHLQAHDYVSVLGPSRSEKSRLLDDVAEALEASHLFEPVYIDLWRARSDDEATFFTSLVWLMSQSPALKSVVPPAAVPNARTFQHYLETCLKPTGRHVALLIDHIQALPRDLVHSLLLALRSIYMERKLETTSRLVAVVTGGMNLAGLSDSPTSPFNIARPVVVTPLTEEQSLALAEATLAAYGHQVSNNALQRLVEWAGGDTYLLPLLCAWSSEAVQGFRRPLITTTVVEGAAQRLEVAHESRARVLEAIQIIEEDPDTLLDILYILDHGALPRSRSRQSITRTGVDRLQLCGALKLAGESFEFKNLTYRQALANHYTPAQVGHVLRMTGRWHEAIEYLAPRIGAQAETETRAHLLEAIVQSIYAADSLEKAYNGLLRGLRLGFGLDDVHIYRADPSRSELRLVGPQPQASEVQAVIELEDRECVEAQTFHHRDYALRRSASDVRLVAALVPEQRAIGLVTVERYVRNVESPGLPEDFPELWRFLRHAAGAIETVMFRAAAKEIGRAVLDASAVQPTLERVLQATSNALGCDVAALYLIDSGDGALELAASVGHLALAESVRVERDGDHPAARCLNERKSLMVRGAEQRPEVGRVERWGGYRDLYVYLPLRAGGTDLGALEVGFQGSLKASLTEEDGRNLILFADQVAIAVYNMELLRRTDEALTRRVQELEKLADISLAVSSTLKLDAVLSRIIDNVRAIFPNTEATIWEYQPDRQELRVLQTSVSDEQYRQQRLSVDSVVGATISVRRAQAVPDVTPRMDLPRQLGGGQLKGYNMMAMPLVKGERVLGAINVYAAAPQRFSPDDADLLSAFAAQAAVAIDNAQQFQALETTRRALEDLRERELFDLANALLHRLGNATGDIPYQLQRAHEAAPDGSGIEEPLSHVERRINSLIDLLVPLRNLVDLKDISQERLDLRDVVKTALHRALACEAISPAVDLPVAPVFVVGNRALLTDAVQSVIENACEAMAGQGWLKLRMVQPDERTVEISVTDSGPGIPDEIFPRIFEPGFSTKATSGETRGKGLFTCRAVLRRHRGLIRAASVPGQGATFVITLPVVPPAGN